MFNNKLNLANKSFNDYDLKLQLIDFITNDCVRMMTYLKSKIDNV